MSAITKTIKKFRILILNSFTFESRTLNAVQAQTRSVRVFSWPLTTLVACVFYLVSAFFGSKGTGIPVYGYYLKKSSAFFITYQVSYFEVCTYSSTRNKAKRKTWSYCKKTGAAASAAVYDVRIYPGIYITCVRVVQASTGSARYATFFFLRPTTAAVYVRAT